MVRESLAQCIHCSQVDREFRVMSALFSVDFPVPRPLCLCTDNNVIGSHFYVMEKVNGRIFRHASFPGASPDERRLLFKSLVETLARLHSINWRAIGLTGYGGRSKKSYCQRQVKYAQTFVERERERETTDILMVSCCRSQFGPVIIVCPVLMERQHMKWKFSWTGYLRTFQNNLIQSVSIIIIIIFDPPLLH